MEKNNGAKKFIIPLDNYERMRTELYFSVTMENLKKSKSSEGCQKSIFDTINY